MLLQRGSFCGCVIRLQAAPAVSGHGDPPTSTRSTSSSGYKGIRPLSTALLGSRTAATLHVSISKPTSRRKKLLAASSTHDADAHVRGAATSAETSGTSDTTVDAPQIPSSTPAKKRDPLNELMHHPALFDPIRKPRNPIVLCHGLYGFDVRGPAGSAYQLHYWGAILEILRGKVGAEVIVSRVPGTGSIEGRAKALDAVLRKEVAGRDVNLLAHSMGGLDARYLISKLKPDAYNILSLTTVSTPHRGSAFMEWCQQKMGLGRDEEVKTQDTPRSTLAHWMGVGLAEYFAALFDSPAYRDLLPSYLEKRFNPSVPDVPGVRYFSVAARTGDLGVWHPLYWPKTVLDAADQKAAKDGQPLPDELKGNDGLVAISSAQWGEFLGVVEKCDHWRIRGSSGFRSSSPLKQELSDAMSKALPKPDNRSSLSEPVLDAARTISDRASALKDEAEGKGVEVVKAAKAVEARSWSWEDVNTIVDPLRSLVNPLNRLLSLVPIRSSSTSATNGAVVLPSPTTRYMSPSVTFFKEGDGIRPSPTTHYLTLSQDFSPSPEGAAKKSTRGSSGILSYLYSGSSKPKVSLTSPTTRYINLSHSMSPPVLTELPKAKAASGGGLFSYFKRSPPCQPSPTTRYIQLSLPFSPLREAPPTSFRSVPNISALLAPPAFFGSSTDKAASKQRGAAESGVKDAFDLERLYVALARKLYDEGL